MQLSEKVLKVLSRPGIAIKHIWRKVPVGSFELRMKFDAFHKPSYAYGVYRAAKLAKALRISRISVIEFGVSKGQGLIELERISQEVEKIFGVSISVLGFDTGSGLTPVIDYRDLPYEWRTGEFQMDVEGLKSKLKKARLILGDVQETIAAEMKNFSDAPIGFISFDLDLYSSTKYAFKVFESGNDTLLPRVSCYFDDVFDPEADCNEFTGELLAIKEFNDEHVDSKISRVRGLSISWNLRSMWTEGMYVFHSFKHAEYNTNVH